MPINKVLECSVKIVGKKTWLIHVNHNKLDDYTTHWIDLKISTIMVLLMISNGKAHLISGGLHV